MRIAGHWCHTLLGFKFSSRLGIGGLLEHSALNRVHNMRGANQNTGHCALANGQVRCWGEGEDGQLGDGNRASAQQPVVALLDKPTQLTGATCAIDAISELWCWGRNADNKSDPARLVGAPRPVQINGLPSGVVSAGSGAGSFCAVADSKVYCWGSNTNGALGQPISARNVYTQPQLDAGLGGKATSVDLGAAFGCALLDTGVVQCWGSNTLGQLGNSDVSPLSASPVNVQGLGGPAIALSVGASSACAILQNGTLKCWGDNDTGQLGAISAPSFSPIPLAVNIPNPPVTSVAMGGSHACAVAAGRVYCWGSNGLAQFGTTRVNASNTPVLVEDIADVSQVAVGLTWTCALTRAGEVACWGSNYAGHLGNNRAWSTTPLVGPGSAKRAEYAYTQPVTDAGTIAHSRPFADAASVKRAHVPTRGHSTVIMLPMSKITRARLALSIVICTLAAIQPWAHGVAQGDARFTPFFDALPSGSSKESGTLYYSFEPIAVGGYVYFAGRMNGNGEELWRTDGTSEGTRQVRESVRRSRRRGGATRLQHRISKQAGHDHNALQLEPPSLVDKRRHARRHTPSCRTVSV